MGALWNSHGQILWFYGSESKKYLDMHSSLGTWEASEWKPRIAPTMSDEATRKSYD